MVDDCAFRLGGLSCEASNFVMASLGILVCFLAGLIVFTGIGLVIHFLVLWVNRRRSRDLAGRSDLDRLRASLASVFGSRLNGPGSETPLGPRNSRVWSDLNLLADRAPPPSYEEAVAMVDLAGHVDESGVHMPDHADEPNGLLPGHADEPDHADEPNGLIPGHADQPGDEDGEQVDQISNGVWV